MLKEGIHFSKQAVSMEDRDDKDKRDLEPPDNAAAYVFPSSELDEGDRSPRRRVTTSGLMKAGARRTIRGIRWILGPAKPLPASDLPRPTPSSSLSLTIGSRSSSLRLDPSITSLNRSLRLQRGLIPFLLLWATANVLLIRQQYYLPSPQIITCDSSIWGDWPPDTCGLNATGCESLLVSGTYRCMAGCRDVVLGNPRWVGGTEVNSVPLIIGGADDTHTYR